MKGDVSGCSNGNGTCISQDNCVCNTGYTGNQCEIPICYGINATNTLVCSNQRGICISKNKCVVG